MIYDRNYSGYAGKAYSGFMSSEMGMGDMRELTERYYAEKIPRIRRDNFLERCRQIYGKVGSFVSSYLNKSLEDEIDEKDLGVDKNNDLSINFEGFDERVEV